MARLQEVLLRARDPTVAASRVNDCYLTFVQLRQRRDLHKQRADLRRVLMHHVQSRLKRFAGVHAMDRMLVRLLAENDIPRVRLVLSRLTVLKIPD